MENRNVHASNLESRTANRCVSGSSLSVLVASCNDQSEFNNSSPNAVASLGSTRNFCSSSVRGSAQAFLFKRVRTLSKLELKCWLLIHEPFDVASFMTVNPL